MALGLLLLSTKTWRGVGTAPLLELASFSTTPAFLGLLRTRMPPALASSLATAATDSMSTAAPCSHGAPKARLKRTAACALVSASDSADSSSSLMQGSMHEAGERTAGVASTSTMMVLEPSGAKSHKRRAAEALLAARYGSAGASLGSSSSDLPALLRQAQTSAAPGTKRGGKAKAGRAAATAAEAQVAAAAAPVPGSVLVKACGPSSGCGGQAAGSWCDMDIRIPHTNWVKVLDSNPASYYSFLMGKGFERIYMPEALQVYLVKNPEHVGDALARLRSSMLDRVIAIDLEWRPDQFSQKQQAQTQQQQQQAAGAGAGATGGSGSSGAAEAIAEPAATKVEPLRTNPVAVIQLASATTCVVLHVAAMGFKLPQAVKDFLSSPDITLVGFGWDGSDEHKFKGSFGFGRSAFVNLLDLQEEAHKLGYHKHSLARLASKVMGFTVAKDKRLSMSNWAAGHLSMQQIKYASLDVFLAGQVFRGLRLWHSSPSQCHSCRTLVGVPLLLEFLRCGCGEQSKDISAHRTHCVNKGHAQQYSECVECGRVSSAAVAASQQQQQQQQAWSDAGPGEDEELEGEEVGAEGGESAAGGQAVAAERAVVAEAEREVVQTAPVGRKRRQH